MGYAGNKNKHLTNPTRFSERLRLALTLAAYIIAQSAVPPRHSAASLGCI